MSYSKRLTYLRSKLRANINMANPDSFGIPLKLISFIFSSKTLFLRSTHYLQSNSIQFCLHNL